LKRYRNNKAACRNDVFSGAICMEQSHDHAASAVITIPNLLSFLRLLLIPVIVHMMIAENNALWAAGLVVLSGLTDLADGFIARRYRMVSDLGKVLDPIADKLTQVAVLGCLALRFPLMLIPLGLLVLKELAAGVMGLLVIRRTGQVYGAEWHGKVSTALLYAMMTLHLLWSGIPAGLSNLLIGLCTAMILYSCVRYTCKNAALLRE
jgi:cardiolipin synthase